jgi:hypothetical protein
MTANGTQYQINNSGYSNGTNGTSTNKSDTGFVISIIDEKGGEIVKPIVEPTKPIVSTDT